MATLHSVQYGRNVPLPAKTGPRLKIDIEQLDHFLSFITSPHLVQDLPFGEKQLQLSTGKVITVPNVIRTMIPQRVIMQYKQYCIEANFKSFSDRTMRRILTECSASVRKSLQGLDYYASDGSRAFDDLASIVQNIAYVKDEGEVWSTQIQDTLKAGKLYFKGDYKVHISEESNVADHCSVYALSDQSDQDLRQLCSHIHSSSCDQCSALDVAISDIEQALKEVNFENEEMRDESTYLFSSAQRAIQAWKCHQLRSVRQDLARTDALQLLDHETILIVNDWAMKFLPQMYRESQQDWFGRRGISWHISVDFRKVDEELQSQAFVHIVQSCSQDSTAVVVMLQHLLRTLKDEHPEIMRANLRQDNAGCYHSSNTILAMAHLKQSIGINIVRVDFSDPQGGKGAADRLAATCKSHIRIYINEGHNVTNAQEMKTALTSCGGIEGVRVAVVEGIDKLPMQDYQKIVGINKLNNFQYTEDCIIAWRAYDIAQGKEIPVEKVSGNKI
ncbi:hypothetical protein QZH41_002391 [Actinostola sp. cb2023]|nr:hypothetical protein QZH41_002391 [Actinostola sp. cb2023]